MMMMSEEINLSSPIFLFLILIFVSFVPLW
jgi:hypothetical protein